MDLNPRLLHRFRVRNMARQALSAMPDEVRFEMYRNMVRVTDGLESDYEFTIARTKQELEQAFRILHDEYVRSGFMQPHPSGLRVTPYHALPSTTTIVGKHRGEVVATVSVIRDSSFGFPLEKIYNPTKFRRNGAKLAEISSLAIRKDYRENAGQLLFPLLKYLYMYCTQYFGIDYKIIAVNPKHIEFYQSILFFEILSATETKNYSFANNAPAVIGALNLHLAYYLFSAHYSGKEDDRNLFRYFTKLQLPNFKLPDRRFHRVWDPVMSPELFEYFFKEKTHLAEEFDLRQVEILHSLYRGKAYDAVLPEPAINSVLNDRMEQRYEVECQATLLSGEVTDVRIHVTDASLHGFQATVPEKLLKESSFTLAIQVSEHLTAQVEAEPVRRGPGQLVGFRILNNPIEWQAFILYLETEFKRLGK